MSTPQELVAQADKKCGPFGGLMRLFGGGSFRFDEAADLYVQAANMYRINKQYAVAGKLFEKAAQVQKKANSPDEAGNTLVDAYKSYQEAPSPPDAARVLQEAIRIFTMRGQWRRAANFKMSLGEVCEEGLRDLAAATRHYEQAGDWYSSDQAPALASKAYVRAADLGAVAGNYIQAAALYENVAKKALNNSLSRWSLKEYFFKSVVCYLAADDMVAARKTLDRFVDWDPGFRQTKEYALLEELVAAIRDRDGQRFADRVYAYDQLSRLDKWKTTILLRIKSAIVEADDDIL